MADLGKLVLPNGNDFLAYTQEELVMMEDGRSLSAHMSDYDDEIAQLNNNITTLQSGKVDKSCFQTVNGKIVSGDNVFSYPSGFNSSNTYVVDYFVILNGYAYHYNDMNNFYCATHADGIHITNNVSSFVNKYCGVLLLRID